MSEKFKHLPLRDGVGLIVLNNENKIFVAKRIDNPKNFWQMPQGGINKGEDYYTAALRELKEETGIQNIKIIKYLGNLFHSDNFPIIDPIGVFIENLTGMNGFSALNHISKYLSSPLNGHLLLFLKSSTNSPNRFNLQLIEGFGYSSLAMESTGILLINFIQFH